MRDNQITYKFNTIGPGIGKPESTAYYDLPFKVGQFSDSFFIHGGRYVNRRFFFQNPPGVHHSGVLVRGVHSS